MTGGIGDDANWTSWTLTRARPAISLFLAKFRNSGNVRLACRAANISRSTIYYWRNKWVTFADEWDEAKEDACDILEGEAWKRAVENQSDRLLMFLLKAHRRKVYGDKMSMEHTGKDGGPMEQIGHNVIRIIVHDDSDSPRLQATDNDGKEP